VLHCAQAFRAVLCFHDDIACMCQLRRSRSTSRHRRQALHLLIPEDSARTHSRSAPLSPIAGPLCTAAATAHKDFGHSQPVLHPTHIMWKWLEGRQHTIRLWRFCRGFDSVALGVCQHRWPIAIVPDPCCKPSSLGVQPSRPQAALRWSNYYSCFARRLWPFRLWPCPSLFSGCSHFRCQTRQIQSLQPLLIASDLLLRPQP
jgi:hypothetical protein